MDLNTEIERIEADNRLESLPANPWQFEIDLGEAPKESICRLKSAMSEIAKYSSENWPSDEEWERMLPIWLLTAIPKLSKEETDKLLVQTPRERWDLLPWDRLSWLDALRDRGWRWWGWVHQRAEKSSLVVHIATYPERIDAFRELLRAAGIRIISENYGARKES